MRFVDTSGRILTKVLRDRQDVDCSNFFLRIFKPACNPQLAPQEQFVVTLVVRAPASPQLPGVVMMPKVDPNDFDEDSGLSR